MPAVVRRGIEPRAGRAPSGRFETEKSEQRNGDQPCRPSARLCRRDLPVRRAAVRRAADVHQDGAAEARRHARGVVGRHGVLPGGAARRLRLRACADEISARQALDRRAPRGDVRRDAIPAACDCAVVGASAGGRDRGVLAARAVRRIDRPAVFRPVSQRTAAAGLVRPHQPSERGQSVLPLCGEQHRQLPRAALLSVRAGAAEHARPADARLGGAVHRADRADRVVRLADAARAAPEAIRSPGEQPSRRRPGATRRTGLSSPRSHRRCSSRSRRTSRPTSRPRRSCG